MIVLADDYLISSSEVLSQVCQLFLENQNCERFEFPECPQAQVFPEEKDMATFPEGILIRSCGNDWVMAVGYVIGGKEVYDCNLVVKKIYCLNSSMSYGDRRDEVIKVLELPNPLYGTLIFGAEGILGCRNVKWLVDALNNAKKEYVLAAEDSQQDFCSKLFYGPEIIKNLYEGVSFYLQVA